LFEQLSLLVQAWLVELATLEWAERCLTIFFALRGTNEVLLTDFEEALKIGVMSCLRSVGLLRLDHHL
jgi:hypothetical protein